MEKEVKISEKVKFWQEQKKINDSLIPRVIEMSEIIKSQTESIKNNSESMLKLEDRLHSKLGVGINKIEGFIEDISIQKKFFEDTIEKNKEFYTKTENLIKEINNQLNNNKVEYHRNHYISKISLFVIFLILLIPIIYLYIRTI